MRSIIISCSTFSSLKRKFRCMFSLIFKHPLLIFYMEIILFVLIMKKLLKYGINSGEENYILLNDMKILPFNCAIIFFYIGILWAKEEIIFVSILNINIAICISAYMGAIREDYSSIKINFKKITTG
ncbi:hypothetical protein HZS_4887 [Henneguya salminicola]|nr:hypothetical protein HZS_4887 [Henneguya salminicola]